MRMKKRVLALLTAALLLAGMLPMGALAAVPPESYEWSTARVYDNNHCEIELYAWGPLENQGFDWDEIERFTYVWNQMNAKNFSEEKTWATYNCTKADVENMVKTQAIMCECAVYDGKQLLTTIKFRVDDFNYAPVVSDFPMPQYIYYTPGETVTISPKKATIASGDYELEYVWNREGELVQGSSSPSIVLTDLDEDDNQTYIYCNVRTIKKSDGIVCGEDTVGDYILLCRANNPIKMPSLSSSVLKYDLARGESHTFKLPAAEPGEANKTLKYDWFILDENWEAKPYRTTTSPELTITSMPDKINKKERYVCRVGYKGENFSRLQYGTELEVYYLPSGPATPTSAPKTGDNTPLTALFLLLGISLAGATLLMGKQRRQS